jgi:hypothetical protein
MKYPVHLYQHPYLEIESWLLTQTRKSQDSSIQLEQEMPFLWRLVQRIPDITLPFPFRLGVDDLDGLLLHLHFLIVEFGHFCSNRLDQTQTCEK